MIYLNSSIGHKDVTKLSVLEIVLTYQSYQPCKEGKKTCAYYRRVSWTRFRTASSLLGFLLNRSLSCAARKQEGIDYLSKQKKKLPQALTLLIQVINLHLPTLVSVMENSLEQNKNKQNHRLQEVCCWEPIK
jgi:hypothetical protein